MRDSRPTPPTSDGETKPSAPKLRIPAHWHDVTSQASGRTFGIGPVTAKVCKLG